ncbi:uncharacterized protein LOC144126147 [Amblyomma americanum]
MTTFRIKMALLPRVMLLSLLCTLDFPSAPLAAVAPYSGQPSTLLGDSQQSALVRAVSKAHAEELDQADRDIAQLVRELKALPQGDAQKDTLAAKLRQRQQELKVMRDKFRDQVLCILKHEADHATAHSEAADEAILRNCTEAAAPSVVLSEAPVSVAERR